MNRKILPFIIYDKIKFTIHNNGYYRSTTGRIRLYLHRYKYEKEVGIIPDKHDIHHKDHCKLNNDLSNLKCIHKSVHGRKHHYTGRFALESSRKIWNSYF